MAPKPGKLRSKVPLVGGRLDSETRARAFTVAGVTQLDVAATVLDALVEAEEKGTSFSEFKVAVADLLEDEWGGEIPGRLETIFRTNLQTAYMAARVEALSTPESLETYPNWRFSAVLDHRTSPMCKDANDTILPAGSYWWDWHTPPLHYSCRSTIIPTSESEGELTKNPLRERPAGGFGKQADLSWEPDLSNRPPALVSAYRRKQEK